MNSPDQDLIQRGNAGIAEGTEWSPTPSAVPAPAPLPGYPTAADLPDTPPRPATFEDILRRAQRAALVDTAAALALGVVIGRLWPVVFP